MLESIFKFYVEFCGEYWLIGSLVLGAVGLLCIGIWCAIQDESFFSENVFFIVLPFILIVAFWPFALAIVLLGAIIVFPMLIGKCIGKPLKWLRDKKRKDIENMNNIEKIINTKDCMQ